MSRAFSTNSVLDSGSFGDPAAGTVAYMSENGDRVSEGANPPARRSAWNFLSNHARVLAALAEDPDIRLRDVADQVGITERAAQSIVADLAHGGFVTRTRVGRRNRYEVHQHTMIVEGGRHLTVADLLAALRPRTASYAEVSFHTSSASNGVSQN